MDLIRDARQLIENKALRLPYRAVIVGEAQDLSAEPMVLRPYYLQDVATFTAPDPWEGNRECAFVLADYVMLAWPPQEPLRPDSRRISLMEHKYALRSGAGNSPHFLPESLVKLWRSGRAGPPELPMLLAALQPQLRKAYDYRESRFTFVRRWVNLLAAAFCLTGLLYRLGSMVLARNYVDVGTWAVLLLGVLLICGTIEFVCGRPARRRAQQTRWALGVLDQARFNSRQDARRGVE